MVFSDTTQRKLLLECVAHENRNTLAGIKAGIQFIGKRHERQDEAGEIFSMILKEVKRLEDIVTGFLHFARSSRSIRMRIKIKDVIEKAVSITSEQIKQ